MDEECHTTLTKKGWDDDSIVGQSKCQAIHY